MSPARKRRERHARAQARIQREAAKDTARFRECLNLIPPTVDLGELRTMMYASQLVGTPDRRRPE